MIRRLQLVPHIVSRETFLNLMRELQRSLSLFLLILLILLLAGCARGGPAAPSDVLEASYLEAEIPVPAAELSGGRILSQSFWSNRAGLSRVTLFMATYGRENEGEIAFRLLDDQGIEQYRERIDAAEVKDNALYHVTFPPLPDSAQRSYTVQVIGHSPEGRGITAWRDEVDRYPGRFRVDGEPHSGDLLLAWAHRATLAAPLAFARETLLPAGIPLLITALLWLLPGAALLPWLRRNGEAWSGSYYLATCITLSGAWLVILPQFTYLLGLPLGSWAPWGLLIAASALLLLARYRRLPLLNIRRPDGLTICYLALLFLLLGSRLLALHPLPAPQWGDSVHHTLITQLLLDHGGIFQNYEPYVPLSSFTYHAGFHLLTMWLSWSTLPGMDPLPVELAVMLNGQLLAVFSAITAGLLAEGLAVRYSRPTARWAAIIALLVAGLLTTMPAFYVNWGRYTQLAGQFFLPAALLWSLRGWSAAQPRRWLAATVLVVAALALTHYRVTAMYAAALPLILILILWQHRGERYSAFRRVAGRIAGSALCVGFIILPWYWTLGEGLLVRALKRSVTASTKAGGYQPEPIPLANLVAFLPGWLVALTAVALLWLLVRRRIGGVFLSSWLLALFILSDPYTFLRLPRTGLVDNFMLQIALYIPVAALVALAAADAADLFSRIERIPIRVGGALAALLFLAVGTHAAWEQIYIAEPSTFNILTRSDRRAMEWIIENTSPEARFHINGFPAYGGNIVAGADGGWWLWLLTGRSTTVPPAVYGHEAGFRETYRIEVNERFARLQEAQNDPEQLAVVMKTEGIDYLYIGARQGTVGKPPEAPVLQPASFQESPLFEKVYSDDFTWIFRVRNP